LAELERSDGDPDKEPSTKSVEDRVFEKPNIMSGHFRIAEQIFNVDLSRATSSHFGCFLVVDPCALAHTKSIYDKTDDDEVTLRSMITVKDPAVRTLMVNGKFGYLKDSHEYIDSSKDGIIVLVRGNSLGAIVKPYVNDRLRARILELISPVASGAYTSKAIDFKYMAAGARAIVLRHMPRFAGVDALIDELVRSEEFSELVLTANIKMYRSRERWEKIKDFNEWAIHGKEDKGLFLIAKKISWLSFFLLMVWWFVTAVNEGSIVGGLFIMGAFYECYRWYSAPRHDVVPFRSGSLLSALRVCGRDLAVPDMRAVCSLVRQDVVCVEKSVGIYGCIIEDAPFVIPDICTINLEKALRIRFLFERDVDAEELVKFKRFAKKFLDTHIGELTIPDISFQEWTKGRYSEARIEELALAAKLPYEKETFFTKNFPKDEIYVGKVPGNWKPRGIMARHDTFLSRNGAYFYAVSKALGDKFDEDENCYYMSKTNSEILTKFVTQKLFSKAHVYESDVSNFEGTLESALLDIEMYFLEEICSRLPPDWGEIKPYWKIVEGGTPLLFFHAEHGRRSGDAWTSSFNSLLNIIIQQWMFPDPSCVVAGDDNIAASDVEVDVDSIINKYAKLGMKVKFKEVTLSTVEFCSGLFAPVVGGYKWGIKPGKVLAKFGFNLKNHHIKFHKRLLYGTAKSLLPIAGHYPVMGMILRRIVETSELSGITPYYDRNHGENPYKPTSVYSDVPTSQTLAWFSNRYDICADAIIALEQQITSLSIDDFPLVWIHPIFKRMFEVDVGAPCNGNSTVVITPIVAEKSERLTFGSFFTPQEKELVLAMYTAFLAPGSEELARYYLDGKFPYFSILIGVFEMIAFKSPLNLLLHLYLGLHVSQRNPWKAFMLHSMFNFMALSTQGLGPRVYDLAVKLPGVILQYLVQSL